MLAPMTRHTPAPDSLWRALLASGLPLTEALDVEAVDISADVAHTVPIFAQAAHARFVYVTQEAPSPGAQASSSNRTVRSIRSPISRASALL